MSHYPLNPYYPMPANPGYACTLKVEGIGSIAVEPNLAEVNLGVTTENTNLSVAQAQNAEKITAIINTLKRMGIPEQDIVTQSYTITPQYDYVEGQQIFRGYQVSHILNVTIRNISQVGQIIDAAVASGANQVNNITFSVANPSLYYQQALTLAIEDAVAKAMIIGRKLQISISATPIRIVEQTFDGGTVEPALMKTADAATPIQTGQLMITAQVEAVFAYPCR